MSCAVQRRGMSVVCASVAATPALPRQDDAAHDGSLGLVGRDSRALPTPRLPAEGQWGVRPSLVVTFIMCKRLPCNSAYYVFTL